MTGAEIGSVKVAQSIATALTSAMDSPSKEIGNYVADRIRLLRYKSLLKIVKRAEAIAKDEGMSLKMPPLKFFVPFCEGASLENADEDATIASLWANLLLNSSEEDDGRSLLYLRILREITKSEAEFLKALVEGGRARTRTRLSWWHIDDIFSFDDELVRIHISELPTNFDDAEIAKAIVDTLECTGVWFTAIIAFPSPSLPDLELFSLYDADRFYATEGSVLALESLGLVKRFKYKGISPPGGQDFHFHCEGVAITELGAAFYSTVTKSDFQHKFDREVQAGQDFDPSWLP